MKLLLFAILALPLAAQVEVHFSRQQDAIVKQIVGKVPKDIALYGAKACNLGSAEVRFSPDRIAFSAATQAPVQDAHAAVYAAQQYRNTSWPAVLLGIGEEASGKAGAGVAALSAVGIVPVWGGVASGIAAFALPIIQQRRQAVTHLEVPANWLTDGLPDIILPPGGCAPAYLLALGGNPEPNFIGAIDGSFAPAPPVSSPAATPNTGIILKPTGEIDAIATIMAARQAQAETTLAALR